MFGVAQLAHPRVSQRLLLPSSFLHVVVAGDPVVALGCHVGVAGAGFRDGVSVFLALREDVKNVSHRRPRRRRVACRREYTRRSCRAARVIL